MLMNIFSNVVTQVWLTLTVIRLFPYFSHPGVCNKYFIFLTIVLEPLLIDRWICFSIFGSIGLERV